MRLTLAQVNFTVGAFDANFARIEAAVGAAARAGSDLVVFSELAATGYPPRDLVTQPRFVDANLDLVERVAALSSSTLAILIGFVDRNPSSQGKPLFNGAAFCRHGRVVERRYKCLLPTYDVFDEARYFEPAATVAPVDFLGRRLGITICEDVWNDPDFWPRQLYHRDPVADLVDAGADLLINISASPFALDKADLRRRMIRQYAVKHARPFFYLNQVGGNDELVFDGHSIAIDRTGRLFLRASEFEEDLVTVDVPDSASDEPAPVLRPVADSDELRARRALVLGLRDYTQKCGFSDVVIGLSGGVDSAVTACLAAEALGPDHVLGVAMPSRYSSAHSVTDAAELARALGIDFRLIPIDDVFQAYLTALAEPFRGLAPDVTEENLQARVRGAMLMALSNKHGALLLTTGNKSELAVGYCTLYGDMCGGLAVVSDVPKMLVYRLAHLINDERRDRPVIPASTLTKAPSAELRPDQKDSDSLPPYDVLDPIIAAYVEEGLDVDAIAARGADPAVAADVIRRIDASEYKRRQAAPGLRISSKAFGVGRRFPIAADYRGVEDATGQRAKGRGQR